MKNEVINLENEDVHVLKKENWKNAVMPMFPFLLLAVTGMKISCFAGVTLSNIALVIIGLMLSIGCISSIRMKKDKKTFILFKSISIFLLSLGFMILTYSIVEQIMNSPYVKELYFCITGMIYIGIIIASYIYINRKIKK